MTEKTEFVHQVFIVDGMGLPDVIPDPIQDNAKSLRSLYPHAAYRCWSGEALQAFISKHFEPEVRAAFDRLAPYSYKSDLARFCLLFHFGGLYVDLGMKMLGRLDPPTGTGLASFRDYEFGSPCWTAVAGGILWAKPGRPEMRVAIDMVLENCRTRYYGTNWLYPTGPVLLGRALIAAKAAKGQTAASDDQWIGASRPLTPEAGITNICYVTPDRTVVAIRAKKHGADLTHLGAVGTNNYATIWRSRAVYGEVVRVWPSTDTSILLSNAARRTATGIAVDTLADGIISWGPYAALEPGRYHFTVTFDRPTVLPKFMQDIVCDFAVFAECIHEQDDCERSKLVMAFAIDEPKVNVEFRTHAFGRLDAEIVEISVETLVDDALAPHEATAPV